MATKEKTGLTEEQLEDLFDKHEDEYLNFEKIPKAQRRHHRPDICAFIFIDEKMPGKGDIISGSRFDEYTIDAGPENYDDPWPLTEDDVIYLLRCGISWQDGGLYSLA